MSQDIVADVLNEIMNRKKARYSDVVVHRHSKLLIKLLELAKNQGYIKELKPMGRSLRIEFELNECRAIKPRYTVDIKEIDKYVRRFLPSRDVGILIISANKGLLTHKQALEKNIGGCLLAYFF